MSSLRRFLSASAASWARILLTILTQVLLVPVFLSHWPVEEYGCWLIIQTVVGVSSILSTGYQNYLGYEFLKLGDGQPLRMRSLFYSALPCGVIIGLFEMLVLVLLIYFGYLAAVFDPNRNLDGNLLHQSSWSLILYSVSWLICSSIGGLATRVVAPYGQFPRMTWWGALLALAVALTSGVAVAFGANLLQTVICVVVVTFVVNVPIHIDMWRIFRRNGLHPLVPDWMTGCRSFMHSLALSLSTALDLSRQQGVRIFLGAIIGVTQMTAFSTMRTLSNLSLQGIGTVTNPIMPEIMRFLRERDSERTNATVGFVWFFTVVLLSPILIGFQWLMPILFQVWTRGKIGFNPSLFGLFSMALLMFSVARPSVAVLQGNNLLRAQLLISIAVSVIAVGGIFALTSHFGVDGAAASLLLAESVGTILAVWSAWKWLDANGIEFPWRLFSVTLASIAVAAIAIYLMIFAPAASVWTMAISLILCSLIAVGFVRSLPAVATARMRGMLKRFF